MTHRRSEFPSSVKRDAYKRSKLGGEVAICECHRIPALKRPDGCGVILRSGHINYEHIDQDALGGRNDLDNCAVLARNCWREKTDTIDLPLIAKNNRQRDRNHGIRPNIFRPMIGTHASNIKKPMRPYARPIDRTTGREL